MHRAPTFAGFDRGHGRQFYPQFSLERLIPIIETATCHFWWKALAIATSPNL